MHLAYVEVTNFQCSKIAMTSSWQKKKLQIFKNLPTTKKKPHWHHVYRNQRSVHKLYYYNITLKYTFDLISKWYGNLLENFFWFHDPKNLHLFSCNKYFLTVLHHALHLLTSDCSLFMFINLSLVMSYKNLVLDQDNNIYLISLGILIICCWIMYRYFGEKLHVTVVITSCS